eukprot:TRINITY_DN33317_c0_g1_i1.p1 TRINITY_DN33317_c0_g1~~TRINITY_DN33317_c0_g1_i1.p1  ORF type:complete len:140 (-),score=13.31 TRINITY_DN33317_c0_g1_i1:367-786(-)
MPSPPNKVEQIDMDVTLSQLQFLSRSGHSKSLLRVFYSFTMLLVNATKSSERGKPRHCSFLVLCQSKSNDRVNKKLTLQEILTIFFQSGQGLYGICSNNGDSDCGDVHGRILGTVEYSRCSLQSDPYLFQAALRLLWPP